MADLTSIYEGLTSEQVAHNERCVTALLRVYRRRDMIDQAVRRYTTPRSRAYMADYPEFAPYTQPNAIKEIRQEFQRLASEARNG